MELDERDHCKRGHPWDIHTTRLAPDGRRYCKMCRCEHNQMARLRKRVRDGLGPGRGRGRPTQTHCKRGHALVEGNLGKRKYDAHKACLICQRARGQVTRVQTQLIEQERDAWREWWTINHGQHYNYPPIVNRIVQQYIPAAAGLDRELAQRLGEAEQQQDPGHA